MPGFIRGDRFCAEMLLCEQTYKAFIKREIVEWWDSPNKNDYRCIAPDPQTFPRRAGEEFSVLPFKYIGDMAVAAPGGRTLAERTSPYHVQLLHMFLERDFQNTDVEDKCRAVLELFRPHLEFMNCDFRLAADALRGYMYLDEANTCPKSRVGTATPWRAYGTTAAEVPTLRGVPKSLHNRFLSEWVSIPLLHESEYLEDIFDDDVTLFHGTIAKCGLKIAEIGFLPGPNGHVKNKRCHKGAFMSTNFYTAMFQSDMT